MGDEGLDPHELKHRGLVTFNPVERGLFEEGGVVYCKHLHPGYYNEQSLGSGSAQRILHSLGA
jgi:hypothetical protein